YYWSLKRMTYHSLTRAFLLIGLCGSWVLPQVSSYLAQVEPIPAVQVYLPAVYGAPINISQIPMAQPAWGWQEWAWLAYGIICAIMFFRLLTGIGRIAVLYLSGTKYRSLGKLHEKYIEDAGKHSRVEQAIAALDPDLRKSEKWPFRLIVNEKVRAPFSFFSSVFVSTSDLNQRPELLSRLLEHEQVHVQRWHSLDLLLIELTRCILWWHPVLPAYKRAVRQSHEFEADAAVLRERKSEKQSYGRQLLNRLDNPTRRLEDQLANQFYHSFISKRLQMMNAIPTSPKLRWKYALIVPILFAGVILFAGSSVKSNSATSYAAMVTDTLPPGTGDRPVFQVVENMPAFPVEAEGLSDAEQTAAAQRGLLEYIYTRIKYPAAARTNGVEGMAVISFVVEENGTLADITIARDPGAGLGEEARRVISQMNEDGIVWSPGRQGGELVRVKMNMPIRFALEGDEEVETSTNMEEGETAPDNSVHVIGYAAQESTPAPAATDEVFRMVEQMPLFPGGEGETYEERKPNAERKMLEYIYSQVKYPTAAREAEAQGMAVVSFVVEKDGTLSDVKIRRDPGHGMGAEAMRVIEAMNDDDIYWEPGMQGGEIVRVQFNMPIRFALSSSTVVEEEVVEELEDRPAGIITEDNNIILGDVARGSNDDGPFYAEFFINGEYAGEVGESESVLNEIDPNDIESITVIKETEEVALMRRNPETQGIILIQLKEDSNRRGRRINRDAIDISNGIDDNIFQAQFATLEEGIQVSYQLNSIDGESKLFIFDTSGRLLETRPFRGGEVRSTVGLKQRGVYIFRIEAEGQAQSYRVSY
ncbi:MAG: TonB family protein, partial [Bacteroidota bacterium]